MLHAKFDANRSNCLVRERTFFIHHDFANGKLLQKWAWPTLNNSAEFRENMDMRFSNVQHIMWELWAKNALALKIVPPTGHFWCESQGPFYRTSLNFISITVMVWAQCQILN